MKHASSSHSIVEHIAERIAIRVLLVEGSVLDLRTDTRAAPEVPFIFVSGATGEERAIDALREGAADDVLKDNPQRLGPAVRRAIANLSR